MVNRAWSFVSGFMLTCACIIIGLLANYAVSGDPFAVIDSSVTAVDVGTVLSSTLFIALSGGHYLGASFDEEDSGRSFALGANSVLWLVIGGFLVYVFQEGGNIIEPAFYAAVLVTVSSGIFAAHKAGHIEDDSKLDVMIDTFSSRGTGIVVTAAFITRTIPDPVLGGVVGLGLIVVGAVLWYYTADELKNWRDTLLEVVAEMSSADESDGTGENPSDKSD